MFVPLFVLPSQAHFGRHTEYSIAFGSINIDGEVVPALHSLANNDYGLQMTSIGHI